MSDDGDVDLEQRLLELRRAAQGDLQWQVDQWRAQNLAILDRWKAESDRADRAERKHAEVQAQRDEALECMRDQCRRKLEYLARAEAAERALAEAQAALGRAEWDGYRNGLQWAGNLKPTVRLEENGVAVLNDLRGQIDAERTRAAATEGRKRSHG